MAYETLHGLTLAYLSKVISCQSLIHFALVNVDLLNLILTQGLSTWSPLPRMFFPKICAWLTSSLHAGCPFSEIFPENLIWNSNTPPFHSIHLPQLYFSYAIYACLCVCVCVCVWEREREREVGVGGIKREIRIETEIERQRVNFLLLTLECKYGRTET